MKRKRNLSEFPSEPSRSGYACLVLYDKKPPTKQEQGQIKQAFYRHAEGRRFERNETDPDDYGHG